MEFENRDFITEYRGSYVRQKIPPVTKYRSKQEFRDPVVESYRKYLSTSEGNESEKTENCYKFVDRFEKTNKKIHDRYFHEPLKIDVVDRTEAHESRTSYHQHYCSFDGYEKFMRPTTEERVPLPEGWVEGTTTQRWYYRNPVILFPNIYKTKCTLIKPPCELDEANKHSLKRKNVSELAGNIGELGTFILENEMHGKIDKFDIEDFSD